MTDIAIPSPTAVVPASFSETKATKVREALSKVRTQYLSVFDDIDAARKKHDQWARDVVARGGPRTSWLYPDLTQVRHPSSEAERADEIGRLNWAIASQPTLAVLGPLRDAAHKASTAKYAPAPTRLVVGLMINAYPNARPHSPESYQEAVVDQVMATGFGPVPIAKACNGLVRTSNFVPSPSEVVAAAESAQEGLLSFTRAVDSLAAMLEWADQARAWVEKIDLLAKDRANYSSFIGPPKSSYEWLHRTVSGRVGWV